jgi:hydroxymethylpyrimidine/phosphomethylpyrimidine kinase
MRYNTHNKKGQIKMITYAIELLKTTKASLTISSGTVVAGLAGIADLIPVFAVLGGFALTIITIIIKRKQNKRDESQEKRNQEKHELEMEILRKQSKCISTNKDKLK